MSASRRSGDHLRGLLGTDIATGAPATRRAAVHLLTFTELPDRPGFGELVDVFDLEWEPGDFVQMGQVSDWAAVLAFAAAAGLSDSDQRMVVLAVSLASGQPVDLATNVAFTEPEHARRVIEAIAIATGHSDKYAVTRKPTSSRSASESTLVDLPPKRSSKRR